MSIVALIIFLFTVGVGGLIVYNTYLALRRASVRNKVTELKLVDEQYIEVVKAKAQIVKGRAEAETNKLKVQAGLTPQERAEYQMKTSIGVAEKLSQVKFPGMMVIGGDSGKGGQALNPFDAVGLESFMRISDKMSNTKGKE